MNSTDASVPSQEFFAVPGDHYLTVLERLHKQMRPKTYLEVGTANGSSLARAKCKSIAVDPKFQIASNIIGDKPSCMFFQCASDLFFAIMIPRCCSARPWT